MAPIALPHPIPTGIPSPHQIQDKPTLEDVKSALTYRDRVNVQYRSMKTETSQDDVVRAEVYLHRVMAAHISEGDALPLAGQTLQGALQVALQPLNHQIAGLSTGVGNLVAQLTILESKVTNMDHRLTRVHQTSLRVLNRQCHNGVGQDYHTIPFNNGSDPVEDHGLPALIDSKSICDLNAQHCAEYCQGYGVAPVPRALADRQKAIAWSVGGMI